MKTIPAPQRPRTSVGEIYDADYETPVNRKKTKGAQARQEASTIIDTLLDQRDKNQSEDELLETQSDSQARFKNVNLDVASGHSVKASNSKDQLLQKICKSQDKIAQSLSDRNKIFETLLKNEKEEECKFIKIVKANMSDAEFPILLQLNNVTSVTEVTKKFLGNCSK